MKGKSGIIMYTMLGGVIGAGLGLMAGKTFCCKAMTLKKTAGKALHAAGSFIEHMSF